MLSPRSIIRTRLTTTTNCIISGIRLKSIAAAQQSSITQPNHAFNQPPTASSSASSQLCRDLRAQKLNDDCKYIGLTGGQIFHQMMLEHDVKHIFGYPGGAILPVFDAIHESPHFQFILPRHEQGNNFDKKEL
jgi:acetolactate synthase-1/2/3 large subunit